MELNQQNIDDYIEQLKTKPMNQLRGNTITQSYYEKRWKLQNEFRKKLDIILQCGNEICFLLKDDSNTLSILKNIEIMSFALDIYLQNINSNFQLDDRVKIVQDFYKDHISKDRLLLIQKQCLLSIQSNDLITPQSANCIPNILLNKAEEIEDEQKKNKLITMIKNKVTVEPLTSNDIVDIQYILNQLYSNISNIPQDQIVLIDKYLALTNFIISVNQIYNFDFISENAKLEKEERTFLVDKERRRIIAQQKNQSSSADQLLRSMEELKSLNHTLENRNQELESKCSELENKCDELENKNLELEAKYQEIHMSLIPIQNLI